MLSVITLISCGEDRSHEFDYLYEHNTWIYELMHDNYLFADKMKSQNPTDGQTNKDFFARPEAYFSKIISPMKDNGSYIEVDTLDIDNHARGYYNHDESYGFDFILMQDPTKSTTKVFARIVTVYKDSPAEKAGLKRNDFIEFVNGYKLSAKNTDLLQTGDKVPLTVKHISLDEETGECRWTGTDEIEIGPSTYVEDIPYPVYKIFEIGNDRVAYLMCTRLTKNAYEKDKTSNKYEQQLQQLMQMFAANKPTHFILDLRLCNFGTLEMANTLASFLLPLEMHDKPFATTFWNPNNQSKNAVIKPNQSSQSSSSPTTLSLHKLTVITSSFTKGAAEWLINGLQYMLGSENVTIVGNTTAGQEFMTEHVGDFKGMIHLYPAVAYVGNGGGDYKCYEDGIMPTIEVEEFNYFNLYEYGDVRETMLNAALQETIK